jgi:hypothetical protein
MILGPNQSSSSGFLSEWNTNARSSGAKTDVMESVPDSLDADTGFSGVQEVRTKGLSRAETIETDLKSKESVFSRSCCSSATSIPSDGCTKHVVPDPSHGNHTLRHTNDVCHMNLHSNTTMRQFILDK